MHTDPIYSPAWPGRAGLLALSDPWITLGSWHISGMGGVTGVASHVRGAPLVATLVLATGPGTSWSLVPPWSHLQPRAPLSNIPLPGSACCLHPGLRGPPWLLGTLYSPHSLEAPKGGYGFSETPWEPCHSCSHRGRDACGRSSWINTGKGEGPSPESLREFADDADQGCVFILEPLVVSPEIGQGL